MKNWIDLYLSYNEDQESPDVFHKYCAISVIASALGRKCNMSRGTYVIYPNHYIILVAASAHCKKSTAMDVAVNQFLDVANCSEIIHTEKMTAEYLYTHLSRTNKAHNDILIHSDELQTFLGVNALHSGIIGALTSVYSCPPKASYRTKGSGTFNLREVCVNLLAGTTLNWMEDNLPGGAVEGGFVGRVLFVVAEKPKRRIAWPTMNNELIEIRKALILDLIRISKLKGTVTVDDCAKDYFKDWYLNFKHVDDQRMNPYFGRKPDAVLKMAMVLSASEFHVDSIDKFIIKIEHIKKALSNLNSIEELMPLAFRGAAFSKTSKDNDRILRQLKEVKNKELTHSALLKKNYYYLNATEFKGVIDTLEESGLITCYVDGRKKIYKLK